MKVCSQPRAGRSHYQFKDWIWDGDVRVGAREVQPVKADRHTPALINTCVYNRKKRTHTLYAIALDLDTHRADARWKHKTKGHLKWPEIRRFLQEEHPKLWSFVFAAVRSTGGQGIALWIAISPMELAPSTARYCWKPELHRSVMDREDLVLYERQQRTEIVHFPDAGHVIRHDATEGYLAAISKFAQTRFLGSVGE